MMTGFGLFVVVFTASAVEAVEALTIVLAMGMTRDWRSALSGAGAALLLLAVLVAVLGPGLTRLPVAGLRLVIGGLLVLRQESMVRAKRVSSECRRRRGRPVGFQKSAWACDLRRSAFHAAGMITDVSLRRARAWGSRRW